MKYVLKKIILWITVFLQLIVPFCTYVFVRRGTPVRKIRFLQHKTSCVVLGNGPSLKNDIESILDNIDKHDFFAVNQFSESEYFVKIKPNKYILLDPYFWDADAAEARKIKRQKAFDCLNKADWVIQLFIPDYADYSSISKSITNKNIQLVRYRISPIELETSHITAKILEKTRIFGPSAFNVLVYAIYFSIMAKYKEIYIYGADMSFHTQICVDQETNALYMVYEHFYGKTEKVPCVKNSQLTKFFTMHEYIKMTASIFYAHEVLNLLAEQLNVKIYNKSSFSLIDAYAR